MVKSKIFIVKYHLFPFDVLVCLGSKREEILKHLKKYTFKLTEKEEKQLQMEGNGRTLILEGNQTILWTRYYPRAGSGTLAHEIFHAVDFLTAKVGINLVAGSEEVYAYAIQYLTNEIFKQL